MDNPLRTRFFLEEGLEKEEFKKRPVFFGVIGGGITLVFIMILLTSYPRVNSRLRSQPDMKKEYHSQNTSSALPKDFDWETYVENYEDLRLAGITTRELAIAHWQEYGAKEGRIYKRSLIPASELASNKEKAMDEALIYWENRLEAVN
ncbi:MAG TPA: hypothetical protein PLO78_03120 [Candidatus Omnitrophota bacterium]|nr:hypothetical protein [Candidatus Omnitrophota bacterium]